jgi:hypothetical protein
MDITSLIINLVLIALTLLVIWYARQTVQESKKATEAARETVVAVKDLLGVAQETATSSGAAAEGARQTVEAARELITVTQDLVAVTQETIETAKAARRAEERAQLERRLRDMGELAESAFWKAAAEEGYQPLAGWRCIEQQYIATALVGVEIELPECHILAGSSQAGVVMRDARDAVNEIATKLREMSIAPAK